MPCLSTDPEQTNGPIPRPTLADPDLLRWTPGHRCRDEVGQLYLGLLVEELDGAEVYLLTPVSADRLYQLETGILDIRGAVKTPEVKEYYTAAPTGDTEVKDPIPLSPVGQPPEKWLPEPGLRVSDFVEPKRGDALNGRKKGW